jgi:hypothetical protein
MNFSLWKNLRKAKKDLQPTSEFKRELWVALDKRWDEVHGTVAWYRLVWVRTTSIMVSGVLGVAMVGTGAYAYNSSEVTEGTPLYGVKQALENVVEKTKTTPEAKAQFLLTVAERREQEKKVIEERIATTVQPTTVPTSTGEVLTPTSSVGEQEVEHDDNVKKTEQAIKKLERRLEDVQKQLSNSPSDQKLKDQIQKRLQNKHDEGEDDQPSIQTSTPVDASSTPVNIEKGDRGKDGGRKENREGKKRGRGTFIDLQNGELSEYAFDTSTASAASSSTSTIHWNLDDREDTDNIIKLLSPATSTQFISSTPDSEIHQDGGSNVSGSTGGSSSGETRESKPEDQRTEDRDSH